MMRTKNTGFYLLMLVVLMISLEASAQNRFQLTQFSMHKPFVNPASITIFNDINAAAVFRRQWVGIDGAPTTSLFNGSMQIRGSSNFAGLTVLADYYGVNQEINVSGIYAYRARVDRKQFLSFALAPSIVMQQSDYSQVALDFESDPLFQQATPNAMMPNVQFGAYFEDPNFYVGIATPALLYNTLEANTGNYTGETDFDINNIHYNIVGGYKREFQNKWELLPSALIKQTPGSPLQADVLLQMQYLDKYGGGISYSTSNTFAAMFNLKLSGNFKLAYCYSYGINAVSAFNSGSHEVMLLFGLWNKKKSYINMPKLMEQYRNDQRKSGNLNKQKNKKVIGRQPY